MSAVVYVPLGASVLVALLSRGASRHMWPRAAAWATTAAGASVAMSSIGALVLLACPLPARVPKIAAAGRWQPAAITARSPVPIWVSVLALAALVVLAVRVGRELRAITREARDASALQRSLARARTGDLVVTRDTQPSAHAIAGFLRPGVVVVSSSMLALLDDDERAAVIAHERSHLRHRHAWFQVAIRLAAALDPVLVGLRVDVRFALERWADEDAAGLTARPVAASALARTALAVLSGEASARPALALALHPHGTTTRVAALLAPPERQVRAAWLLAAIASTAALALAWAMKDAERFFEAARLWSHR